MLTTSTLLRNQNKRPHPQTGSSRLLRLWPVPAPKFWENFSAWSLQVLI